MSINWNIIKNKSYIEHNMKETNWIIYHQKEIRFHKNLRFRWVATISWSERFVNFTRIRPSSFAWVEVARERAEAMAMERNSMVLIYWMNTLEVDCKLLFFDVRAIDFKWRLWIMSSLITCHFEETFSFEASEFLLRMSFVNTYFLYHTYLRREILDLSRQCGSRTQPRRLDIDLCQHVIIN